MPKKKTSEPWERLEGESSKAYEAFSAYRDMGSQRSLSKVAEKLGKSETLMGRWSSAYQWRERAAKWDDEQNRMARESQLEEIRKMRKRHAGLAYSMLVKAGRALKTMPEEEIKAADISRMVEIASKLERVSRGDVGEVIESREGETLPVVQFYIPDNGRTSVTTETPGQEEEVTRHETDQGKEW